MSSTNRSGQSSPALEVCACSPATVRTLTDPTRHRILSVLFERGTVPTAELADAIASSTTRSERTSAALWHLHVPALEAAGLISVDRASGSVSLCSHPDVRDGPLSARLLGLVDEGVWTAVGAIHDDPWRTEVFAFLAESGPSSTLAALTRRVAQSFERRVDDAVTTGTPGGPVSSALHHVHLPRLSAVGLLSYDGDSGAVAYAGGEWFELQSLVETLPDA